MIERRPALGKGLSALIPDAPEPPRSGVTEVDIDLLAPNQLQPRVQMDDARLQELTDSIKANGIIQPILVRRTGSTYRIIAGERRWRAAQRAGLHKVPVVVRDVPEGADQELLELALVENIQRENLNAIDEALAYRRLADQFGLTQCARTWPPELCRWDTPGRSCRFPTHPRSATPRGKSSPGGSRFGTPSCSSRSWQNRPDQPRLRRRSPKETSIPAPPKTGCDSRWEHGCESFAAARVGSFRLISARKTS